MSTTWAAWLASRAWRRSAGSSWKGSPCCAEQARRRAGAAVTRPAWKNLVFTGGPGSGKTRAARAVTRIYTELGLLAYGHLREITAADLVGPTLQETGTLVADAARRASGDLLMINDAHAWDELPDRGRHLLRCLYQELTGSRDHSDGQLGVILAGRASPLRDLLCASPALAARFPAVVNFPGYTAGQLAAIFAALACEPGPRPPAPPVRPLPPWPRPKAATTPATPGWPSGCSTRPPPARAAGSQLLPSPAIRPR